MGCRGAADEFTELEKVIPTRVLSLPQSISITGGQTRNSGKALLGSVLQQVVWLGKNKQQVPLLAPSPRREVSLFLIWV